MRAMLWAALICAPSIGLAAPKKLLPGDQHSPPVILDVPSTWLQVVGRGSDGYVLSSWFRIAGAKGGSDRLRMDVRAGGKVVGTAECETNFQSSTLTGSCQLAKPIKAKGALEVDLVYIDDSDDKEYLARKLKTSIRYWKGIGPDHYWGHVPDDLLAATFVRFSEASHAFHKPIFDFWSSANLSGNHQLRCTVDGKPLPDIEAHLDNSASSQQNEISSSFTQPKLQRTYTFKHIGLAANIHWGKREDFGSYDATKVRWMRDNPGKWDCTLRMKGKPVRQFLFTVNAEGMIEPSEMQKGKNAIPTLPDTVLVDMKIPKDHGVEERIRQDALKKSLYFGIPWPDHPKAKELQSAFPASMGLPD